MFSRKPELQNIAAQAAIEWHSRVARSFAEAYQRSPRFAERATLWERFMEAHLPIGGVVLDAGCGAGELSLIAAKRASRVVAFDGSREMIQIAWERAIKLKTGKVSFEVADIADIGKFGQGSFDLVMSSSVLEYQRDLDGALIKHAAMLKPNGRLLVSVPNGASLYRAFERGLFAVSGFPRYRAIVHNVLRQSQFLQALRNAGLTPIEVATYGAAPGFGFATRRLGLSNLGDTMLLVAVRPSVS
jgi:2-polyprenyl-3-methyl-5-hydroxy-6-metoxy-1,4-benzoquinol methylase